jgi:hypothetical protein
LIPEKSRESLAKRPGRTSIGERQLLDRDWMVWGFGLQGGGATAPATNPAAALRWTWLNSAVRARFWTRSAPGGSSRHREPYRTPRAADWGPVEAHHSGGRHGVAVSGADVVPARVWAESRTVQHQRNTRKLPRVSARGIRHRA